QTVEYILYLINNYLPSKFDRKVDSQTRKNVTADIANLKNNLELLQKIIIDKKGAIYNDSLTKE
ncbi:MAG: hypothetical protein JW737_10020, partial [Acidobacteria bacterium]|nr:hypothetical protein [Acidobacteriota bacterium]